jgi:glycosyltransferase involved in cell wall biosynthesis
LNTLGQPLFSVLVPCYNYGRYLRQCLASVQMQSIDSFEVIIIDDASTDNTPELAHELAAADQRITVSMHLNNRGHIMTYNEGIEWASGRYFLLLSADDMIAPGAFSRAAALFDEHPDVVMSYGDCVEITDDGYVVDTAAEQPQSPWTIMTGRDFVLFSGGRNIVPTPTAIVRTEVQKRIGGYRRELPHAGDMELWLRFASEGSVGRIKEVQAIRRLHLNNMSNAYAMSIILDLEQRKAALDIFFEERLTRFAHPEQLRHECYAALAQEYIRGAKCALAQSRELECEELMRSAGRIDPGVADEREWRTLQWMRRNPAIWSATRSVAKKLEQKSRHLSPLLRSFRSLTGI